MSNATLVSSLTVSYQLVLRDVLRVLDRTGQRIVFVADETGRLVGAISDGDVRRGLIAGHGLDEAATAVMNRNFVTLPDSMREDEARAHVGDRISVIPMIDAEGRPTRFISQKNPGYIPAAEPMLGENELAYVVDCVKSGWISSQGSYVKAFEDAFASYTGIGARQSVSVSNGTVALQLALTTLGVGPGHEVIVPDLTFAGAMPEYG